MPSLILVASSWFYHAANWASSKTIRGECWSTFTSSCPCNFAVILEFVVRRAFYLQGDTVHLELFASFRVKTHFISVVYELACSIICNLDKESAFMKNLTSMRTGIGPDQVQIFLHHRNFYITGNEMRKLITSFQSPTSSRNYRCLKTTRKGFLAILFDGYVFVRISYNNLD